MTQALILAGGRGTRLRKVTKGGQKVAVKVGQTTFLEFLLKKLENENFSKVYIATGYKHTEVASIINSLKSTLNIQLIREKHPLGTGGAIVNAMQHLDLDDLVVLNGDTYNDYNYATFFQEHLQSENDITILVKKIKKSERYGSVSLNEHNNVYAFVENDGSLENVFVNVGVYGIKRKALTKLDPHFFSFERYLADNVNTLKIGAVESQQRFIDIGTPEDYCLFTRNFEV